MKIKTLVASLVLGFGGMTVAQAVPTQYSPAGTPNTANYSFTAATTGNIVAYFTGSFTAGFLSTVQLLVNGSAVGGFVLPNLSTPFGAATNLGSVNAGDAIGFRLNVIDTVSGADSIILNSNKALNPNSQQQIYSYSYVSSGDGIPSGTYVGWEDLKFNSTTFKNDYDYNDNTYVFTNVAAKETPLPLPTTPLLLGLGLGVMALISRRKQA